MHSRDDLLSFYNTLELPRTADDAAIKKAYRKLALRWHPDKNPNNKDEAEKKFKRIAQAYEILSDPKKRSTYEHSTNDSRSHRSRRHTHANFFHEFRSPFEVFRDFFGSHYFSSFADDDFFFNPSGFEDRFNFHGSKDRRRSSSKTRTRFSFDHSDVENDCSFSTVIRFSAGEPGKNALTRKTSISTKFVDGVKVVTKRTEDNGRETIEVSEDGVMKTKLINGNTVEIAA